MPITRSKSKDISQQKCIINKNQEEPVCFICWDISQPTNKIIKMKELILNAGCDCNSEIHINCLFNWINVSKSCPICRINITSDY